VDSGSRPRASAWDGTRPGSAAAALAAGGAAGTEEEMEQMLTSMAAQMAQGLAGAMSQAMDPDRMPADLVVAIYLGDELGRQLSLPPPNGMTPEITAALRRVGDRAKQKIEEGTIPSAAIFRQTLDAVAKRAGKEATTLFAAAASILKISPDKAKELYDQGAAAAPGAPAGGG
jgi:hypothetical protein